MADKRYTVSEVLELLEGEELLEDDVSDIVCTVDLRARIVMFQKVMELTVMVLQC